MSRMQLFTKIGTRILDFPARIMGFLQTPASPIPFITLRVGIAVVLLSRAFVEFNVLQELYGNSGLIPWAISELRPFGWVPSMSWASHYLGYLGLTENGSVYVIFGTYTIALLGMLVGFQTRVFSIIAWLTHLTLFESASFSSYGVDSFVNIALFYCAIMPKGALVPLHLLFSKGSLQPTVRAGTLLRLIQIHMCVVYLTSGIEKAKGVEWWNGEAIWRSVMQPQFFVFDMSWLANFPIVATAASIGTLVVEIGYAFLIWPRKTRKLWLVAVISMHLAIAAVLGLRFFGLVLIVLNAAAFGSDIISLAIARIGSFRFFQGKTISDSSSASVAT